MGFKQASPIVGNDELPMVSEPASKRPGATDVRWDQVVVRGDHAYPLLSMILWETGKADIGPFWVDVQGHVFPRLNRIFLTKGTPGVACDDEKLVRVGDPAYHEDTYWHQAMDWTALLHIAQNQGRLRVDHIIGSVRSDFRGVDDKAKLALRIAGIDLDKDLDLPEGWREDWQLRHDTTAMLKHALKVKRFGLFRRLAKEGTTFHGFNFQPPQVIVSWANEGKIEANERKARSEVYKRIVTQLNAWRLIFDAVAAELNG